MARIANSCDWKPDHVFVVYGLNSVVSGVAMMKEGDVSEWGYSAGHYQSTSTSGLVTR